MLGDPLRYRGNQTTYGADLDFAVSVHGTTPQWLQDSLATSPGELATYSSERPGADARAVVTADHNRSADEVLLLHGVAKGFSFLPHLGLPAIVVQSQFTGPGTAFRTVGVEVNSLVLPSPYALRPVLADIHENVSPPHSQQLNGRMVIISNPTNPTGVTHPVDDLRGLASHYGILVVDEAFMGIADGETIQRCSLADCRPGETNSIPEDVVAFCSITKTWTITGLRRSHILETPELLAKLARLRPY